jgi:hypothetical protein
MNEVQKVELGYIIPSDITEDQHRALCSEVMGCHDRAQEAVKVCQFQIGDLYNSITFAFGDRQKYVKSVWPNLNPQYVKQCGNVAKMAPITKSKSTLILDRHSQTGEAIAQTSVRSDTIPFTLYVEAIKNTTQDEFDEAIKWALVGLEKPAGNFRTPTVIEMREHVRELTDYVAPVKVTQSAEAEFEKAMDALPKATSKKAKEEFGRVMDVLKSEHAATIKKGVQAAVKKAMPHPLTLDEHALIAACLDPARHPEATEEYTKAAEIFALTRPNNA